MTMRKLGSGQANILKESIDWLGPTPDPSEGKRETEVAADHVGEPEGSIMPLKGLPFCLSLFHLVSKTASADFPITISNSSEVNFISVFGFLIASTHSASGVNTFGLGKPLPNITL
jgi:hypothetical protein